MEMIKMLTEGIRQYGQLRDCIKCDGFNYSCNTYQSLVEITNDTCVWYKILDK